MIIATAILNIDKNKLTLLKIIKMAENPTIHYQFTGYETAPRKSFSVDGTATWDGVSLTITGYNADQLKHLMAGDGLLIDNQLAIVARKPTNLSSSHISIALFVPFENNFTNEPIKVAYGSSHGSYLQEWFVKGDDFEISGNAYDEAINFNKPIGLQLVKGNSLVSVGSGNIAKEGQGGGSSYFASNGIYNDEGTIKLGTNLTEDTDIPNPDNKFFRVGNSGDAINLNVEIPIEYQTLANTFSGFDYIKDDFSSFIGVLKGLNFAPLDFANQDIIGTFAVHGNPFDELNPDGQVFIDGILHDNVEQEVVQQKAVIAFDSNGMRLTGNTQADGEQHQFIQGDNAEQTILILGYNAEQSQGIEGDNAEQIQGIQGDNAMQSQGIQGDDAVQSQFILGDDGYQRQRIEGDNAEQNIGIQGDNGKNYRLIEGDDSIIRDRIEGERGAIKREIIDVISGNSFLEEIRSNSHITTLSGDYDYTADNFFFRSGSTRAVLSLDSFSLTNGMADLRHSLVNNGDFYLGRDSSYYALKYDALTKKMGFFNAIPVSQQIVPLGSSTDDVIQALQNLGLFIES